MCMCNLITRILQSESKKRTLIFMIIKIKYDKFISVNHNDQRSIELLNSKQYG